VSYMHHRYREAIRAFLSHDAAPAGGHSEPSAEEGDIP